MKRGSVSLPVILVSSLLISMGAAGFASAVKSYIQNHVESVSLAPLDDVTPASTRDESTRGGPTPTLAPTPTVTPTPGVRTKPSINGVRGGDDEFEREFDE